MSICGKIILFFLFCAVLNALVGISFDELLVGEENQDDLSFIFGSTGIRGEFIGQDFDSTYRELCEDGSDDYCEVEWRGIVWLSCNSLGLIFGILTLVSAFSLEFNFPIRGRCICLSNTNNGLAFCLVSFFFFLTAGLVWWIRNPFLYEDALFFGDIVEGPSWWLVTNAVDLYLISACWFSYVWRNSNASVGRTLGSTNSVNSAGSVNSVNAVGGGSYNGNNTSSRSSGSSSSCVCLCCQKQQSNEAIGAEINAKRKPKDGTIGSTGIKKSTFGDFATSPPPKNSSSDRALAWTEGAGEGQRQAWNGYTGPTAFSVAAGAGGSPRAPNTGASGTYAGRGGKATVKVNVNVKY